MTCNNQKTNQPLTVEVCNYGDYYCFNSTYSGGFKRGCAGESVIYQFRQPIFGIELSGAGCKKVVNENTNRESTHCLCVTNQCNWINDDRWTHGFFGQTYCSTSRYSTITALNVVFNVSYFNNISSMYIISTIVPLTTFYLHLYNLAKMSSLFLITIRFIQYYITITLWIILWKTIIKNSFQHIV